VPHEGIELVLERRPLLSVRVRLAVSDTSAFVPSFKVTRLVAPQG